MFRDRADAGAQLATGLDEYRGRDDVLVLGIPRGGVVVALEIARHLRAPLDVLVVRKLGVPTQPELAMGAVASGGVRVLKPEVIAEAAVAEAEVEAVTRRERSEVLRREHEYRDGRAPLETAGRTVLLVDDGLATGATMLAAIAAARRRSAGLVVTAAPVGAEATCEEIAESADGLVCLLCPRPFVSVGSWYQDFEPVSDETVRRCLRAALAFPVRHAEPAPGR